MKQRRGSIAFRIAGKPPSSGNVPSLANGHPHALSTTYEEAEQNGSPAAGVPSRLANGDKKVATPGKKARQQSARDDHALANGTDPSMKQSKAKLKASSSLDHGGALNEKAPSERSSTTCTLQ